MNNKEKRILFLRTKLENESENLNSDDFFKLVKHKIGWAEYNSLYAEYAKNLLLDEQTFSKLTELGINTLEKLEIELNQEISDKRAERKKLHNDSIISGWKRKTFWPIFIFGLFGGVYSGMDLFNKITESKQFQEKQITKEKTESELSKQYTSPVNGKNQDSLRQNNSDIKMESELNDK